MEKFLERSAMTLAGASLAIHLYLLGLYGGVSYGAAVMCDFRYTPISGAWVSHSDPFYLMGGTSLYVSWPLMIFLALKIFERGWVTSLILTLGPLAALLGWYWTRQVLDLAHTEPNKYFNIVRETSVEASIVWLFLAASVLAQTTVTLMKIFQEKEGRDKN